MKRLTLALLTIMSIGASFIMSEAPATACTPHPEDPDGCNNWPPRSIDIEELKVKKPIPWPGPLCLSCPPNILVQDQLILKESILAPSQLRSRVNPLDRSRLNERIGQY